RDLRARGEVAVRLAKRLPSGLAGVELEEAGHVVHDRRQARDAVARAPRHPEEARAGRVDLAEPRLGLVVRGAEELARAPRRRGRRRGAPGGPPRAAGPGARGAPADLVLAGLAPGPGRERGEARAGARPAGGAEPRDGRGLDVGLAAPRALERVERRRGIVDD